MVALLPSPELQFCDSNGNPYAAGTLATYVPATTTPKATWSESTGTTLNTNPIVLDSAGRCIVYADGVYRMILKDASGNTIWDQNSNTLVSVAMAPVCIAPDLTTAKGLLGIVDNAPALAVLTAGAAAEVTARTAETTRATAAEAALTAVDVTNAAAIVTERTRALAAEAAIGSGLFKSGQGGVTDASGHFRVTFSVAFPTSCIAFVATIINPGLSAFIFSIQADRFGADVWCSTSYFSAVPGATFFWIATGA